MAKKCLIALAIVSMFAGSVAQADPAWGVTTAMVYEWAKKSCEVSVYMKIVRWAQIYCCKPIFLIQMAEGNDSGLWNEGDFLGCGWVKVCNNFEHLQVDAVLTPSQDVYVQKWYLSIQEYTNEHTTLFSMDTPDDHPLPQWGSNASKNGASDSCLVDLPNLTGALGWLSICVRAQGVDAQSAQFFPDQPMQNIKEVAKVKLTYYPADAPGIADLWWGAVASDPDGAQPANLNDPDVPWNPQDGGGAGIPGSQWAPTFIYPE